MTKPTAVPAEAPYEDSEISVKISLRDEAKQFKEEQAKILRKPASRAPMKKASAGTAAKPMN